jgi:hypothetical protein
MSVRWFLHTLAAVGLILVPLPAVTAQQNVPSAPLVPPKTSHQRTISPAEYALMREILDQMLQQAAEGTPKANPSCPSPGEPPLKCPTMVKPRTNSGTDAVGVANHAPQMHSRQLLLPAPIDMSSTAPRTASSPGVEPHSTAALLGCWQRKTDLFSSTLQIKSDHLYLEVEINGEGWHGSKVGITADYVVLKDQRTVLCYVTGIDLDTRILTRSGGQESFSKTLLEFQRSFVETAIAIKVAMYEDTFVISSVRIPLLAEQDESSRLLLQVLTGRYQRLPIRVRQ